MLVITLHLNENNNNSIEILNNSILFDNSHSMQLFK